MNTKNIIKLSIFLILNLNADEVFKNVAEGILLNNNIKNVEVINAKPLKENEAILEIAFKDNYTNSVSFIYAISDDTIIIGNKIRNGKIDKNFSQEVLSNYEFAKSSDIFLNTLKQESISINDFDENKETIYLVANLNNTDLKFIANSNNFTNYNLKLLLINSDNSQLEKVLSFYENTKFTKEEFKDFLSNEKSDKMISLKNFNKLNQIKKVLIEEESIAYNEKMGNEILYFFNNARINLTQLIKKVESK